MLKRVVAMQTVEDFSEVSAKLALEQNRYQLFQEIRVAHMCLLAYDLLDNVELEKLSDKIRNGEFPVKELYANGSESANIVHRLQLLGYCNSGISQHISRYLEKACI